MTEIEKIFWLDKWEGKTSSWRVPFREFDMIENLKKIKNKLVGIVVDEENHIIDFIFEATDSNPELQLVKAQEVIA